MICTGCEREVNKVTRRYKEKPYCSSCYNIYFKRRPCPICGENSRLPTFDESAICIQCEKLKPCIRCGRHGKPLGKLTKYGPMCVSCRNRDTRKPTAERTQSSPLGTCSSCHRHRPLTKAENGQKLCKRCLELGIVSCPVCRRAMPAGRVSMCESCYWEQLYEKRVSMNATALYGTSFEDLWEEYAHWLKERRGANGAALIINKYITFFLEVLKIGSRIPPYSELLSHFGAEGLRRVRNVVTWLEETGKIEVDERIKNYVVEEGRVKQLLRTFESDSDTAQLLWRYYKHLQKKLAHNQTSIRSIRLALSPAVALLQQSYAERRNPNQNDIAVFVRNRPGQFAAITGFVNFVNRHTSLELKLPQKPKNSENKRKRNLERQLLTLYSKTPRDANDEKRWIELGIMYFHNIPKNYLKTRTLTFVRDPQGGYLVTLETNRYWLPEMRDI